MARVADRVRHAVFAADNTKSIAGRARARRWELFFGRFPDLGDMQVLDLGGTPSTWSALPIRPRSLTLLNLDHFDCPSWATYIDGDACVPPAEVTSQKYDLVYSNSVIEHVGGFARRQAFAITAMTHAPHLWVQTPAKTFPLEPHWLFPMFQYLPTPTKAIISQRWKLGHVRSNTRHEAMGDVLGVDLVGAAEMRFLFPDTEILRERMAGLTKSYIAVR
jgi:hypothetical protein